MTADGAGWLDRLAGQGAGREALVVAERRLDAVALAERASGLAGRLEAVGVEAGALTALLAEPSAAGVALIHALLDRRVVMLPLNLRWTEAEHRAALESHRLDWLVVDSETRALGERLAEATGAGLLWLGADADEGPRLDWLRSPCADGSDAREAGRAALRAQDAALVLLTSGTSGRPKGAVLTRRNLIASAEGSIALLGTRPDDRWLLCMPLFHIGGLSVLIRSALAGTSVVLHRRFEAEAVDEALDRDRITAVSLVATMLARLIERRGTRRAPDPLRLVLLGGGPAPRSLLERALSLGFPLAPTYGLTEAASQVATRPPGATGGPNDDPASGLRPLPGVELRIVDESGAPLAPGRDGEIQVRGPTVMSGYLDAPEETARALRDGWLATGDLGRLDAAGGLRVLDRRQDLIVSGGENVYPAEVESVLIAHPDVADAGVVGAPDPEYGARPLACVVAAASRRIEPAELLEFCRRRLAGYKVPSRILLVDALPRTATGKLRRRTLSDSLASGD